MYDNNKSEYEFSYSNLPDFINHQTASWASYPSYYVNGFDSYTDLIIGGYQPEERYCDILLSIISNTDCEGEYKPESASLYTVLQWFDDYEEVREFAEDIPEFLSETLEYQGANAVFSYTLGSVTECVGVSEKYAEIKNCNQFQKNILDKTILDSNPITAEKAGGWALNQLRQITEMSVQPVKYVFRTIENATFDSTYALYESSETLNSQLQKPETNEVKEDISKIIYKKFTTGGDLIIDYMSEGTAAIPKVLIKSVRNTYPANQLLTASEKMGEVSDCYFIQKFIKSHDASSIFEDTEKNYYYTRLLLQTTLTAHEAFIENDALKFIIGEECSNIILERCDKIGELINKMSVSDISFYSTEGIPDGFGDINAVVYKYNKNSTDENTTAYTWQLEPSIEAENIIVSDDSNDKYPLWNTKQTERPSDVYSIIQRDGKYSLIDYEGQLYNDKFYTLFSMGDYGEIILSSSTPENIDSGNDIIVSYDQSGECKIDEVYVGGRGSAGWDSFYYDYSDKAVHVSGPGDPKNYGSFTRSVNIPIWGEAVNRAVLLNEKGETLYGCYYDGDFTVEPQYNRGKMSFYSDMIAFFDRNKWGYFNGKTGEQIIDFSCNGVAKTYHYMNSDLPPYMYTEGLLALYSDVGCKYVDAAGNEIIPIGEFEEVRPVHKGLAWVKQNGKWGVIQFTNQYSEDVEVESSSETDNTAESLVNKSVLEIVELMNGSFELGYAKAVWYTPGQVYFYNDDVFPGLQFCLESLYPMDTGGANVIDEYHDKIVEMIKKGEVDLCLISATSVGKVNDLLTVSEGMKYSDLTKIYGNFECNIGGASGYVTYRVPNTNTILTFEPSDEMRKNTDNLKYYNSKTGQNIVNHAELLYYDTELLFVNVFPTSKELA